MSNYKTWNVRKRHEWLASPKKPHRVKRRSARRVGLLEAWTRRGERGTAEATAPDASSEATEA